MAKQPYWLPVDVPDFSIVSRSAWDEILLGGVTVPGEAQLHDEGDISIKVDKQNAKGTKGNDFVQTGFDFAKFSILVTLFSQAEWDLWQEFVTTILPVQKARGNAPPQSIYHPALASVGIENCIILAVGIPRRGKISQTVEIEIKCEQWAKVKAVKTTKPLDAAAKNKGLRTLVTAREEQWRDQYQKDKGSSLPADQIPPMPPSFARPGPNG